MSRQLPQGASTGIDGNEAYTIFSEVVNHLENVDARWRAVLRKCRVKENDPWSKGFCQDNFPKDLQLELMEMKPILFFLKW